MKQPAIYMMSNKRNGVVYTGVTSNLVKRVYEHKRGCIDGFTKRYNCIMLVFFEIHYDMEAAIFREKQIKAGCRKNKIKLIEKDNPLWIDLFDQIAR